MVAMWLALAVANGSYNYVVVKSYSLVSVR